jgi:hypothetical protein
MDRLPSPRRPADPLSPLRPGASTSSILGRFGSKRHDVGSVTTSGSVWPSPSKSKEGRLSRPPMAPVSAAISGANLGSFSRASYQREQELWRQRQSTYSSPPHTALASERSVFLTISKLSNCRNDRTSRVTFLSKSIKPVAYLSFFRQPNKNSKNDS